jgi:hypothetical protein
VDEQNRRELLKLPLAAGALTLAARADAQAQAGGAGKQRKRLTSSTPRTSSWRTASAFGRATTTSCF